MAKIVIIEDTDEIRAVLYAMLKEAGFDVVAAENGEEGVKKATEELPDLIISDVMMPILDGYQVIEQLKENPETAAIPFVFLTSLSEFSMLREGMNRGANDYLVKPFKRDELLKVINNQLEKKRATSRYYMNEMKKLENRLDYLTQYDQLTGLPNRLKLRELFDEYKAKGSPFMALALIDVDRFREVNEVLGYSAADILIKQFTERLENTFPDSALVRLQGTQILMLANLPDDSESVQQLGDKILKTVFRPFDSEGLEVLFTLSVGITLYPKHSGDVNSLVQYASDAIGKIKLRGGNNFQVYVPGEINSSSRKLALEAAMRYGVERSEFQVYYQAKIEAVSQKLIGAEALVRWIHPEMGFISPAEFIPTAEDNGLIIPIGEQVLQKAASQVVDWRGRGLKDFKIAVNLSPRQFNQPDLVEMILLTISKIGLDPKNLELEVTESALVQDTAQAQATLKQLREAGISTALDDFGTGFSSLSYLSRFPFDTLKIDRSFVTGLPENSVNGTIVNSIIQMAHRLNIAVVAEGVENAAEFKFLLDQECDEIQGYYFHKPEPAQRFMQTFNL